MSISHKAGTIESKANTTEWIEFIKQEHLFITIQNWLHIRT